MKKFWKKMAGMAAVLAFIIGFTACNPTPPPAGFTPNQQILDLFTANFPTAERVNWVRKDIYAVAAFRVPENNDYKGMVAWFTNTTDPVLILTQEDLNEWTYLPAAVRAAFAASHFNRPEIWKIDEVEAHYRLYPNEHVVYKIELDAIQAGYQDVDLFYAEDGTLIKEEYSDHNNGYNSEWDEDDIPVTPATYADYINYLNAEFPDYYLDDLDALHTRDYGTVMKAELKAKNNPQKEIEVYMTSGSISWLATSMEIEDRELPGAVWDAAVERYKKSEGWEIEDDFKKWEIPDGIFYSVEAEWEQPGKDLECMALFEPDGTLYLEYQKF